MFQLEDLYKIAGKENVQCDELLSKHTTFHIGGAARYFVSPAYVEDFIEVIRYVKKENMPYFIMGNGSNLLAYDTGYEGVIVAAHMPNRRIAECGGKLPLDALKIYEVGEDGREQFASLVSEEETEGKTIVFAGCGIMLSALANTIGKKGLTGFEFAGGIPGTLGGAVTMNAGAYGGEIKDCILGAQVLMPDGTAVFLKKEELELGYRTSRIQKEEMIVLWVLFAFSSGNAKEIEAVMRELNRKRREKQPLQYGSAGSTFKRPEGHFAGKLIEDAGLKGYRIGDVMVSDKHCGFVVNVGKGTYEEARQVIEHVQQTVQEKFGIWLEPEVRMIK